MSSRRDETHNRKAGRDARKGKEESELEGIERELVERQNVLTNWTPRTELGRMVKAGKFTTLDDVFNSGKNNGTRNS